MSRSFDGTDDNVSILNALGGYPTASKCSYSFWVKLNTSVANQIIWQSFGTSGAAFDGQGMNEQNGKFLFQESWTGSTALWITNSAYLNDLKWHHIAITFDNSSTANDPIFYLDGVSVAITESTAPSGSAKTVKDCIRLCENSTGGADGNMKIAHFQVYINTILTPSQINQIMRFPASIGGGGGTNILYWPLWGGSPEPDYSGNGNHGTVTGATVSSDNPPINGLYYPRVFRNEYAMTTPAGGGGWPYTNTGCHVLLDRWRRVA